MVTTTIIGSGVEHRKKNEGKTIGNKDSGVQRGTADSDCNGRSYTVAG
jgi:hypothetical protein